MTQTGPNDEDLLTVKEVAKLCRVDETTVRRWIQGGALEGITLPGLKKHMFRIKRKTVNALLTPTKIQ